MLRAYEQSLSGYKNSFEGKFRARDLPFFRLYLIDKDENEGLAGFEMMRSEFVKGLAHASCV